MPTATDKIFSLDDVQTILSDFFTKNVSAQQGSGVTQYIGARYVPMFSDPLDWDKAKTYEPLTIVLYQGNSYTSRQSVPSGIEITNTQFWAETGNYNAQIEQYRAEVNEIQKEVNEIKNSFDNVPYVTYKQFGAKLDGATDDSAAVIAAHKFANENDVAVASFGGKLLANFSVDVKTDLFMKTELIVNDSTPTTIYNFIHDSTVDDITGLAVNAGQDTFPQLKGKYANITSTETAWSLGIRQVQTDKNEYFHKQPIAVADNGEILTAYPIISGSNVTATNISNLDEKPITVSFGKVSLTYSNRSVRNLIRISRNNVILDGMALVPKATAESAGAGDSFIQIINCCHVSLRNIIVLNNSIYNDDSFKYSLEINSSFDIAIYNCVFSQGWGAIASHFCDTVNCCNSVINRFDNHYGCFGEFSCLNNKFTGKGEVWCGYGNAIFIVEGCDFRSATNMFAGARSDFNSNRFDGTFIFVNNLINPEYKPTSAIFKCLSSQENGLLHNGPTYIIKDIVSKTQYFIGEGSLSDIIMYNLIIDNCNLTNDSGIETGVGAHNIAKITNSNFTNYVFNGQCEVSNCSFTVSTDSSRIGAYGEYGVIMKNCNIISNKDVNLVCGDNVNSFITGCTFNHGVSKFRSNAKIYGAGNIATAFTGFANTTPGEVVTYA